MDSAAHSLWEHTVSVFRTAVPGDGETVGRVGDLASSFERSFRVASDDEAGDGER